MIADEGFATTINGASIEAIDVALFGFNVEGGGIAARTLPGHSNCTGAFITTNHVNNGSIEIDHCEGQAIIADNVVTGGRISVAFSGGSVIDHNRVIAGDGFQLFMSRDVTVRGNVARDNAGDGFFLNASEAVLKRNKAIGNGENGFEIGLVSFGDLTKNRAIGNRFFGIRQNARFAGDPAGGDGVYKKNKCRRNRLGASSPRGLCKRK